MLIKENCSLLPYNTFRIEANTRYLVEYSSENELVELLKSDILQHHKLFHIGGGSNLLFTKDFDGVILHSKIIGYEIISENSDSIFLKVGSGEIWDDVVSYCVDNNWYGTENLSLIPGETGAAAVQNIGAYGVELQDIVDSVEAINIKSGKKKVFTNSECCYAYRESIFKKELSNQYIITRVVFNLSKSVEFKLDYGNIKDSLKEFSELNLAIIRETIISIRKSKLPDPDMVGNAGSFFMNPYITIENYENLKLTYPTFPHYPISETHVKVPAGWLIEKCGWKGKSLGNAGVHDKQSLVLINKGGAKASEIIELSNQIRASVSEKFGIDLTPEVLFI